MLKEYLKENNLIIVPNSIKKKTIEEINTYDLVNYKIMDLKEFLDNYYYTYNKKTINYVMNKYSTNYKIACEYLDTLNYLTDKEYNSKKLNELLDLKKELLENNLLEKNNLFLTYLDNVNIIIINYKLDSFYRNIFDKYNPQIIDFEYSPKDLDIYEFDNIDDEVSFVCNDIIEKINNGYDINKLKIIKSGSEYDLILNRMFKFYNIPLDNNFKISLYSINIAKEVIDLLKDNKSFEEVIEIIKDKISEDVFNKIINIFNNYVDFDTIPIDMIIYDFKNTYLKNNHLTNSVGITSFDSLKDNEFGYLIGFNKENYPNISKDEDLLSDFMLKELDLFTTNDKNINSKKNLINNLYKNNNYIITYKLRDNFTEYNPSILIDELNMNIIKNNEVTYNKSNFYNRIKLTYDLDNFNKYGIISNSLKILNSNYPNLEYLTYDNKFTGLDNNKYLFKLSNLNKFTLSYTTLDNYFRCPFKYYLASILNIKEENGDYTERNIGTIFHYVLSHYRDPGFDFEISWNEAISGFELSPKELVILNNLKDELKYDIEIIKKQESYGTLDGFKPEEKVVFDIKNNKLSNLCFDGRIDKILYKEEANKTLVSVIDYKTGKLHSDLSNVIEGIDMQLPTYAYLIKKSGMFNNPQIVGFYLQKLINKDTKNSDDKESKLKLVGYSNSDFDVISEFDSTFMNSEYIASLSVTKEGRFHSNSKVLSDDNFDELNNIIEKNINTAVDNILDGNFEIKPKRINYKDISCDRCPYSDICYRKEKDYSDLKKHNGLDFLGGDNNDRLD